MSTDARSEKKDTYKEGLITQFNKVLEKKDEFHRNTATILKEVAINEIIKSIEKCKITFEYGVEFVEAFKAFQKYLYARINISNSGMIFIDGQNTKNDVVDAFCNMYGKITNTPRCDPIIIGLICIKIGPVGSNNLSFYFNGKTPESVIKYVDHNGVNSCGYKITEAHY